MTDWHGRFGGVEWRVTPEGIEIRGEGLRRTPGEPSSMRLYLAIWGDAVRDAARAEGVPASLILMTIATENGAAWLEGQRLRYPPVRKEPGYRSDEETPNRISVGPCHLLISTARAAMAEESIDRARLLDPAFNIRCAARYIATQQETTGHDPVLVAAAYNAGGLYDSGDPSSRWHNRWHLRSYGAHLDRASTWYGDACAVFEEAFELAALEDAGLGRAGVAPA